jgi:hypothetical protein
MYITFLAFFSLVAGFRIVDFGRFGTPLLPAEAVQADLF